MRRALLLATVVVIAAVTPAIARGSVVTEVGGELAKQGAKAAIAQLAPDLYKHIDSTSAQLQAIGDQLNALDQKLNDLKAYTASVQLRLECATNVSHLNTILGAADTNLRTLTFAASETGVQRTIQLDNLAGAALLMRSQQSDLNHTLIGSFGLIQACGGKMEQGFGNGRFITSKLRPEVEALYAAYRAAHISLLTAQVNAATYAAAKAGKPDDPSTDRFVGTLVREVEGYIASEEKEIRPAIPAEFAYDKNYDILMKVQPISGTARDSLAKPLLSSGWWVTGYTTVPTCSAVEATIRPFTAAQLRSWAVINFPVDGNIKCYDDSDVLHLFDVNTFTYTRPAIKHAFTLIVVPALVWRPNNGYIKPKEYSYLLTK